MTLNSHKLILLNLGCGTRYHTDWINLDFSAPDKNIQAVDLNRGIPYPDDSCDVVYHSHLLEHFTKSDAKRFMEECYRVLKPGGIIRIAVPNLEPIVRNYLEFMEKSLQGDHVAEANYDWTMLELYDQCVRNQGGGEMKKYFRLHDPVNRDFVRNRIGHFYDLMSKANHIEPPTSSWKKNIKNMLPIDFVRNVIKMIIAKLPGRKYYKVGKFRLSGEIHQWMYDRLSLARLLKDSGFKDIEQKSASQSNFPNWIQYNLDTEPDGTVYKADSLFMEAKK